MNRNLKRRRFSRLVRALGVLLGLLAVSLLVASAQTIGSEPEMTLAWSSLEKESTTSAAWGDWDNDGDLDLAVGNDGQNRVYANLGGNLVLVWSSAEEDETFSVAWGDWDNDGDLDLAVGNDGQNRVYANQDGGLELAWSSDETDRTRSVAWGDLDGDGDLDLAVGNWNENRVYTNEGGSLILAWSFARMDNTTSVAWGDWDNDGDLDLAVGNYGDNPNRVYANQDGSLELAWSSPEGDDTRSVAWGDWDGDGDLDLAVGNFGQPNGVYANQGGNLVLAWFSDETDDTESVAWGDWDSDGDLDLAVGNYDQPNQVYANEGNSLELAWSAPLIDTARTVSVAWGDWDGDGDLDLAVGNWYSYPDEQPNRVYANQGDSLILAWYLANFDYTSSVAWGDWDGDGDLDLAVGNWYSYFDEQPNRVYANEGGSLLTQVWFSPERDKTTSLAWGDWDGDGDLDLAVGNYKQPNRVYANEETNLVLAWSSPQTDDTLSVAWGDWDNDGDLDLAVGNYGQNWVYANQDGRLELAWSSDEWDITRSVAWGDWDGDGDLDLAVGNYDQPNRVYQNTGNPDPQQRLILAWSSAKMDNTTSVAWGDWDGDGDLDLAVGNDGQPNRVYANQNGSLSLAWSSPRRDYTESVAWGDWDGDGDLDLAAGNDNQPNLVYQNTGYLDPQQRLILAWSSPETDNTSGLAWGDWDQDGDLDLMVGNVSSWPNCLYRNRSADQPALPDRATTARITHPGSAAAPFFASATVLEGPTLPITYTLFDPEGHPARLVKAYYSLDGGSIWRPAVATSDTITTNLAASPTGVAHTFTWDVYASGVFGASDSTVFRLDVYQGFAGPGPYQHPFRTARTLPFRLRGSQVRVLDAAEQPVADALVLRLPKDHSGPFQFYSDGRQRPLPTNPAGYLLGRGELAEDDQLAALAPITATESYTLYHTNATPTLTGLDAYTVTAKGVQTLTVSADHPLLLFNLDIALEWDASHDDLFLAQLQHDLERTSATLYDWTNGQAALGRLRIFPDAKRSADSGQLDWQPWLDAHLRIYASNRLRPSAAQGGIVVTKTLALSATQPITYWPGQVHIGAIWNRYGEPEGNLGEDWPRVLAHELGHYALFLNDNYLGLDDDGLLIPVDTCPGAMADPYTDAESEFHPEIDWLPDCQQTLSHQEAGRADWQTIHHFYPDLHEPAVPFNEVLAGPSNLPLAVDHIEVIEPTAIITETLSLPIFNLTDEEGGAYYAGASARAFLFQGGDRLTDLGGPTGDQLQARGARPGDRLCVADLAAQRLGCEEISVGDERLMLIDRPDWQPGVILTPGATRILTITVTNAPAGQSLKAQLYPLNDPAPEAIDLTLSGQDYTGAFNLEEPALEGYVHVWVEEAAPRREIVTDYIIGGGSPGYRRGHGGYRRGHGAPVMSADGQVILFGESLSLAKGELLIMQTATILPDLPPWLTAVGQGYWLAASPNAPDLDDASLAFSYLGSDVPPGEEHWLRIYFRPSAGQAWLPLDTTLDLAHNVAVAPVQGPGLYALMSSIEYTLYGPGWNDFPYPIQETRPVTEALQSIDGFYTQVCRHLATDHEDPWKCFGFDAANWVNDLEALQYDSYWVYVTQTVTLRLRGGASPTQSRRSIEPRPLHAGSTTPLATHTFGLPPAIFYGPVLPGPGFTPAPGLPVTAWIDGHFCGQSETLAVADEIVYTINVLGDGPGGAPGCGLPGRLITFQVDGRAMAATPAWDNSQMWEQPLQPAAALAPATFYGPLLPGPGFTPAPGLPVTAWIGDQLCGRSHTQQVGDKVVYAIDVPADSGCGSPGRLVRFQVGSQMMTTVAAWDNDRLQSLALSPVAPKKVYAPLMMKR